MIGTILVRSSRTAPVSERVTGLCCPFCKDTLDGRDAFVECAACATWFHEECFLENRGCMTMGCREQRSGRTVVRARAAPARRAASPPTPYLTTEGGVTVVRRTCRLDFTLALIHALAFATIAMIPAALEARHHAALVLPSGITAGAFMLALELGLRSRTGKPARLSGLSQLVCVLCGLFSGLVGVPLLIMGVVGLLVR